MKQSSGRTRRGRPATGRALSAAERARRYRARLRARGVRLKSVMRRDPVLEAVRFDPDTLLTPGEQDLLRVFCAGFRKLPRLPRRAAVFGSRARGSSDERSDLDVAVYFDGARDRETESRLASIAGEAARRYRSGRYGILLRPVPLYHPADAAFAAAIEAQAQTIWSAPR
jgi:hypothetical protein